MKVRMLIECVVDGVDDENIQAELETALETVAILDEVTLVSWMEVKK